MQVLPPPPKKKCCLVRVYPPAPPVSISLVVSKFIVTQCLFFPISPFYVQEKGDPYQYVISLCKTKNIPNIAILQKNTTKGGRAYNIGYFDKARVFGGSK
jgi:hypothetical protein